MADEPGRDTPDPRQSPAIHDAADLLGGRSSVKIVLGDQTYILRLTRAGKLLLTK